MISKQLLKYRSLLQDIERNIDNFKQYILLNCYKNVKYILAYKCWFSWIGTRSAMPSLVLLPPVVWDGISSGLEEPDSIWEQGIMYLLRFMEVSILRFHRLLKLERLPPEGLLWTSELEPFREKREINYDIFFKLLGNTECLKKMYTVFTVLFYQRKQMDMYLLHCSVC